MGHLTRAVPAKVGEELTIFEQAVRQMPVLLNRLLDSGFVDRVGDALPKSGVYVFDDEDRPIYVGRSKRLRDRLREHCAPSSGHNTATFAFMLARMDAESKGLTLPKTRKKCQEMPEFATLYAGARQRIAAMQVKVVEVEDDVEQTLFEVYAALALKTPYNSWETH